ncbi:MAG: hypothetical protein JGK38_15375 [Microcoleus sp. PH2017_15_JOR_U_A]|nr:hypothetical protein [Microcoleus sp. PH2017_05_CCC_O_A]MCC3497977.1 hypothetical protein [Microcoleus sp. PH2017_15_JOR_U_A]
MTGKLIDCLVLVLKTNISHYSHRCCNLHYTHGLTGTVGGANFPEILSIAGFKSTIDMAGDREMGVIFSSYHP